MALKFSPQTNAMILQSRQIAQQLGNDFIEIEHFMLAMLQETTQSKASQYLASIMPLDEWGEFLEAKANLRSKAKWHITLSK